MKRLSLSLISGKAAAAVGAAAALLAAGCSNGEVSPDTAAVAAALGNQGGVLGFENAAAWTVSQGTKSAQGDRTEGSFSLGVAGFTYTEIRSPALSNLAGPTGTMALDFKAAVSPAWGSAQLFASIPSRNVWNAHLGQVSLAGGSAGSWRTLSFTVPTNVLAALQQSYTDLTLKVVLNLPQTAQPYLVDNLRFAGSTGPSVVTLDVSGVDDFVFMTVNGVRRKVVPLGTTVDGLDVSNWFVSGMNSVRIQTVNTTGPSSYAAKLRVNGNVVVDASCTNAPCNPAVPGGVGIVFDQTFAVTTPNRPAASTLNVNDAAGGKIYINDAYTGFSTPHTFSLPAGEYTVGVGVGEGAPGAYEGSFFQQTIQLGSAPLTITPSSGTAVAPNRTRIAILPIRRAINGTGGPQNTGILLDSEIPIMHGQTLATGALYVKPFSYGLTTWQVDVLPVVENTPIYREADPKNEAVPDAGRFFREANLTSLHQSYDIVILFLSKYTAQGGVVANPPCCFWGGGQTMWFPNHMTRNGESPNDPNVYLLHESLHNYESYNDGQLRLYNGIGGTHGSGWHGYYSGDNGEIDFLQYYRRFMRNQVAEVNTMRDGTKWTAPLPTTADLWVGVFDTMRRDVRWPSMTTFTTSSAGSGGEPSQPTCALRAPNEQ